MGPTALHLKLLAIALILFSSAAGVAIPLLSRRRRRHLHHLPFALAKAFAAGVILATGFVHMLPGAMDSLSSLSDFPFPGFAAMLAALGTLVVDFVGTRVYEGRDGNEKGKGVEVGAEGGENSRREDEDEDEDEDENGMHIAGVRAHVADRHGCRRELDDAESSSSSSSHMRYIVVSQVLELGIVSHSVIIGLSLGVSQNPSTIKPLIAALSFHQFFEGFALGGCISQACFHELKETLMACFFAITTPGGIAIGLATASFYDSESPTALAVEGILDSISAGILIYMSLVDLIAADFLDHQKTNDVLLQVGSYVALFLGAGFMSLLAIWA